MERGFNNKFLRIMDHRANYINTKSAGKNAFLLGLIFVPAFIFVWLQIQCMDMNYKLNDLKETRDRLKSQNRELSYRLKYMASEAYMEKTAREIYSFKNPGPSEIVVVKRSRTITEKFLGLFESGKTRNKRRS